MGIKIDNKKQLWFCLVSLIIIYLLLSDWQKDYDKKCEAQGGTSTLHYKQIKCKMPDGTFTKIDAKW